MQAKPPPDSLDVEPLRLRRASHENTVDPRRVEPGREHLHRGEHADLAGLQPVVELAPLRRRGLAGDVLRGHAALL